MNKLEAEIRKIDVGDVADRAFAIKDMKKPEAVTGQIIFNAFESEAREKIIGDMNA